MCDLGEQSINSLNKFRTTTSKKRGKKILITQISHTHTWKKKLKRGKKNVSRESGLLFYFCSCLQRCFSTNFSFSLSRPGAILLWEKSYSSISRTHDVYNVKIKNLINRFEKTKSFVPCVNHSWLTCLIEIKENKNTKFISVRDIYLFFIDNKKVLVQFNKSYQLTSVELSLEILRIIAS